MKKLFLIFLLLKLSYSYSQLNSYADNSSLLRVVNLGTDPEDFPTVVFLYEDSMMVERKVFSGKNDNTLIYQSYYSDDTLICIDYWRNGGTKKIQKYEADTSHSFYYSKFSTEIYCENGQLISKSYSNLTTTQHLISYYCNGNKASEMNWNPIFVHGVTGEYISWYENGQIQTEEFYDEKGYRIGEWKYWKEDGTLDRIEIYKDDELVETK